MIVMIRWATLMGRCEFPSCSTSRGRCCLGRVDGNTMVLGGVDRCHRRRRRRRHICRLLREQQRKDGVVVRAKEKKGDFFAFNNDEANAADATNNNNNVRPAKEKRKKTVSDLMTRTRKRNDDGAGKDAKTSSAAKPKRGTRKIEGLDSRASEEREKLWARATKTEKKAKSNAEEKYGYLFGIGTRRTDATANGEKNKKKKTTRSRGQSREDVHGAYKAHKERYSKAITCEFEEEREQFKERLESWTLARLKNEGYCLTDMRARYEGTIGRDALVRVLRPRRDLPKNTPLGEELPFHRISVGDMVILSDNEVERVTLEDTDAAGGSKGSSIRTTSSKSSLVNVLFNIAIPEDDLETCRDGENGRRLRIDLSATLSRTIERFLL